MSYSVIGIIAIVVHLIINRDVLWHEDENTGITAYKEYRDYIFGMLVFCSTDVAWGFLNEYRLITPLYVVTVLFFVTMMAGFLLWTRYVAVYLEEKNNSVFRKALFIAGIVMFCCEIAILIVNFFIPIQFRFDENGDYQAGGARYVTLMLQVALFLMTSVYTIMAKTSSSRAKYQMRRSMGLFGIIMAALIVIQLFYPLLPLYSIGYLISSCMLHSFVLEEEKDEYRKNLQEMLEQTQKQSRELSDAMRKVYTDPLTGLGSKRAYLDDAEEVQKRIREGTVEDFGVIVFDINDLKFINDSEGHDKGDICIYSASMLINEFFPVSPVYRIGGDEFVVILEGDAYKTRREQLEAFDRQIYSNIKTGRVVIASGMSEYRRGSDNSYRDVFQRADTQMYLRKNELKSMQTVRQPLMI